MLESGQMFQMEQTDKKIVEILLQLIRILNLLYQTNLEMLCECQKLKIPFWC